MKSGHKISPSTSPGSDQEHLFNVYFNLADQGLIILIFHSLSYIAVLHTECLKSTATRLRFNEVMHCAAFPLKLLFYHISELFWCHINLSRASQMCRTGSTVGRGCRLGLFGNGERGSALVLVLRGAWQGNRLWPYSHPAPLVQVSSWRTTPVRATSEIYHSAPLPRKSGHYIMFGLFGLPLGCLVT